MAFTGVLITNNGKVLLANAQLNKNFKLKCIRVGDGYYTGDRASISTVVNPLYDVNPVIKQDGNKLYVEADITSKMHNNYYLREIAVIAEDDIGNEVLYAYDNAGGDAEFISGDNGILVEKRIRIVLIISEEMNVMINDPGILYALAKETDERMDLRKAIYFQNEYPETNEKEFCWVRQFRDMADLKSIIAVLLTDNKIVLEMTDDDMSPYKIRTYEGDESVSNMKEGTDLESNQIGVIAV